MYKMWIVATIVLIALPGCVGDQRNRQAVKQELPGIGFAPPLPKENAPVAWIPADVTASNNANQQSQTGLINAAVGKFAETIKPEISAIRGDLTGIKGDVTGIKSEIRTEIANRFDIEFKAQNTATVKAISDFKVEVNQNVEALKNASIENQAGYRNEISKLQQEITGNHNSVINNDRQTLKDAHDAHMNTVDKFAWLLVQVITAFLLLLRYALTLSTKKEMHRDELEHQEDMALIGKRKTSLIPKKYGE